MRRFTIAAFLLLMAGIAAAEQACAGDAPAWMHAVVNAPLPPHDEKTDAVLLYSEEILNVQGSGKIKSISRRVYKILRPAGRDYGMIRAFYDSESKITGIHGWCIPAQGKDYEVKDKEVLETALFGVQNGELVSDLKTKLLQIPAADPGNIVGYEVEQEHRPYVLEDEWSFQEEVPVREARYTLQLPAGWEYKTAWMNHAPAEPTPAGNNSWQWVMTGLEAVKHEDEMPPWRGVAARMVLTLTPPGGSGQKGFASWKEEGNWEAGLEQGRRDPSPDIKQKAAQLTASLPGQTEKMKALADFVQHDIRYVAIELGIGGWQPHPAASIFANRYGDCKDKVALMGSMLGEIGVESYYVSINTSRGAVTAQTPPSMGLFDHEIIAVRLPEKIKDDESLIATMIHPKLGKLLFFDPTDELTPFGKLNGALQANYGLLVTPDGGELVELPQLPPVLNGVRRTGKLSLSAAGTVSGDIEEIRVGDRAWSQRWALRTVTNNADRIKPIETLLAHSLGTFQITKASIDNLHTTEAPFVYDYSVVAQSYAKPAGNLLLVRPRFIGNKSSDLLEKKEPRKYPVEFDGPSRDTDTFEITLPAGYEVDDLPPPVDADFGFASYHSKTEAAGNTIKYSRTFEVKELSVPVSKVDDLKKLYRIIASDERNTAVLKPVGH